MNNFSKAVLILGSNQGNCLEYIKRAIEKIETEIGNIVVASGLYETSAWGYHDQPDFLNQVIIVDTLLKPDDLLSQILKIEKTLGRVRTEKWRQRTIDIDILFYDNIIVNTHDLKIPHPMIAERKFTLVPLAEIIPDYIHPLLKKSIINLMNECSDKSIVNKFLPVSDKL